MVQRKSMTCSAQERLRVVSLKSRLRLTYVAERNGLSGPEHGAELSWAITLRFSRVFRPLCLRTMVGGLFSVPLGHFSPLSISPSSLSLASFSLPMVGEMVSIVEGEDPRVQGGSLHASLGPAPFFPVVSVFHLFCSVLFY